jgi:hypothetical protein
MSGSPTLDNATDRRRFMPPLKDVTALPLTLPRFTCAGDKQRHVRQRQGTQASQHDSDRTRRSHHHTQA